MPERTAKKSQHRLLHALVAVGAALTGGTMIACSAGDTPLGSDAGSDAAVDGPYARIMPPPLGDASYPQIMTPYGRIVAVHAADAATPDSQTSDADASDPTLSPDADYPRITPGCGPPPCH
jgi:hypothetical protein